MILETKQTTMAYRCPHCGAGVMCTVGFFALSAGMIRLKCSNCHESEMTAVMQRDGTVRLTVPCMVCPRPHGFTVSRQVFFGRDLFVLSCPYSGLNIAMTGEQNAVKAELARGELELLDLMEKSGVPAGEFDRFRNDEQSLPDPQILDIVMFVINELDAEGKIHCKCPPEENDRVYDARVTDDGIEVSCRRCGASRLIPTDSRLSAHAFLNADALGLE